MDFMEKYYLPCVHHHHRSEEEIYNPGILEKCKSMGVADPFPKVEEGSRDSRCSFGQGGHVPETYRIRRCQSCRGVQDCNERDDQFHGGAPRRGRARLPQDFCRLSAYARGRGHAREQDFGRTGLRRNLACSAHYLWSFGLVAG